MTPFAYATPHSNAPYIERPRSGVGIYEDESANEGEGQGHEHGSTTDQIEFATEETGYEARALSDYDSDEERGSVELGQERQLDEEWKGVQDDAANSSFHSGLGPLGLKNDDKDNASDGSSVPSVYPSTQQPRQVDTPLFSGTKAGFKIHVDEEVDDEV
jgi:hypothetical protein